MALPTSRAPKGPREGWGLTGVTQRGQQDSEYRWVARRQWAGFPFPAGARHRGLVQPRIISGSPKAFWSPPGPPPSPLRPGAAARQRRAEGVMGCGRPQNPYWISPG